MTLSETVLITAEQRESLEKIDELADAYRFAIEKLADQAVEVLGLDRNVASCDANTLRSIVLSGVSVEKALQLITDRRAGAALQRLAGKPVGVMTDQREVAS